MPSQPITVSAVKIQVQAIPIFCDVMLVSLIAPPSSGISVQRHEDRLPRLAVHRATDVPLAGGVLGEQDVSGAEDAPRPVADLDLDVSVQHDHVLPSGRVVPVVVVVTAGLAKDDA